MTDTPATSNDDLLLATIANDGVPPVDAPLRTDGPTLAEYIAAGYDVETYPPHGYAEREPPPLEAEHAAQETVSPFLADAFGLTPPQPTATTATQVRDEQHADSGYRPVGGAEVQDYMRAKSMGMQGRPSREQVIAFLASKGA